MSDLGNNEQPKTQQEAGTPTASASTSAHAVLALPAPPSKEQTKNVQKIDLGDSEGNGGTTFKFDELGPLVVNSDGTLSRITNWKELSQDERDRTVRLLVKKRNLARLDAQTPPPSDSNGAPLLSTAASNGASARSIEESSSTLPDLSGPSHGTMVDPHSVGKLEARWVEEKIVDLLRDARKSMDADTEDKEATEVKRYDETS